MSWHFHPDAANDYLDVCQYYLDVDANLALAFITAFEASINDVVTHPEAWPEIEEDVRRRLLKRFPFGIYYVLEKDQILVLAVQHVKRKPKSFQERARWQP